MVFGSDVTDGIDRDCVLSVLSFMYTATGLIVSVISCDRKVDWIVNSGASVSMEERWSYETVL